MAVVVKLSAGPAEFGRQKHIELNLLDADGRSLAKLEGDIEIPTPDSGRLATAQFVYNLMQLQFPQSGDYQFSLLVDGDEKESIPLHLVKRSQGG